MTTYEYELVKMDPVETDVDKIEEILSDRGGSGFRFVAVQKFWTQDAEFNPIQRNYLVLEKSEEEEL